MVLGREVPRVRAAVPVSGAHGDCGDRQCGVRGALAQRHDPIAHGAAHREQKKQGVRQMVVLTGIAHYETNRFVDGVRQAVPWIQQLWKSR